MCAARQLELRKSRTEHFGLYASCSQTSPPVSSLPTGIGLSKLVTPGDRRPGERRTFRSIASQGIQKLKSNQVVFVRSDTNSARSSSSCSSSQSSRSNPRVGGGSDCGTKGRRGRGGSGSDGGDGVGNADASGRHTGAGHDRKSPYHDETYLKRGSAAGGGDKKNPSSPLVAVTAAAGASGTSYRRHSGGGSGKRQSGRVACSAGQGDDTRLRIESGGRDRGTEHCRGSSNGENVIARAMDVPRIQPMLAFHLLLRIVVRGTQWARSKGRRSANALVTRIGGEED